MHSRRLQHSIEYGAVRAVMAAAGALPLTVSQRIGAGAGAFAFDVLKVRRGVSVDNIERSLAVSRKEAEGIARRSYQNFGRCLFEFSTFARRSNAQMRDLIRLEGMEHMQAALDGGRGAVFVTGHHGNFELMGASVAIYGFPTDFIVGHQSNERVDGLINDLRRTQGVGIITRGLALRQVLQSLAKNRIVALLADQDAGSQGIMVDFLGRPASTVRGPALFAIRRRCPIVTGFSHREGTHHRGVLQPPIYPPDLPEEEAVRWLTQAHTDALAAHVRAYPDEYFWPHRRWKTKTV